MSIVRDNLLSRAGYTPYCGDGNCRHRMPRTRFNGAQFECRCGWQSGFEAAFVEQYKVAQERLTAGKAGSLSSGERAHDK